MKIIYFSSILHIARVMSLAGRFILMKLPSHHFSSLKIHTERERTFLGKHRGGPRGPQMQKYCQKSREAEGDQKPGGGAKCNARFLLPYARYSNSCAHTHQLWLACWKPFSGTILVVDYIAILLSLEDQSWNALGTSRDSITEFHLECQETLGLCSDQPRTHMHPHFHPPQLLASLFSPLFILSPCSKSFSSVVLQFVSTMHNFYTSEERKFY